jgi:hypothetical protein
MKEIEKSERALLIGLLIGLLISLFICLTISGLVIFGLLILSLIVCQKSGLGKQEKEVLIRDARTAGDCSLPSQERGNARSAGISRKERNKRAMELTTASHGH